MLSAFRLLVRNSLREAYPTVWALAGESIALALGLLVYRYTARAFAPSFGAAEPGTGDYFTFIVVGESALLMPLILFEGVTRVIRSAVAGGYFEGLLLLRSSPQASLALSALAALPRELARVLVTLALGTAALGLGVRWSGLPLFLAYELAALPALLGLGWIAGAVLVRFGRGSSILGHVATVILFLAGAYFPVSVLPEALRSLSRALPAFPTLVEGARAALSGAPEPAGHPMVALLAWGLVLLPAGYASLELSLRHRRRDGNPFLL